MSPNASDAVIRRALRAYPGFSSDARVSPMSGGLINQSFSISEGGVEYVLQRVNEIFRPEIHQNIEAVTAHLSAKGVATPRLLATREGALFADLGAEGRWRIMTRSAGSVFDTCPSAEMAHSAGALVAAFHAALADLEHDFEPLGFAFHDTPVYLAQLEAAIDRHREHRLHKDTTEIAQQVLSAVRDLPDPHALPARPAHGDLKFNNILFRDTEASCLIDLDTLCRLPLAFELGDAWRSWCNRAGEDSSEAQLDLELFRAAAEGYLSANEPVDGEIESLVLGLDYMSLELAARFAADALEESYFGWDRERFSSAGEHNLVRARGQLSLYHQARESREVRSQILRVVVP